MLGRSVMCHVGYENDSELGSVMARDTKDVRTKLQVLLPPNSATNSVTVSVGCHLMG